MRGLVFMLNIARAIFPNCGCGKMPRTLFLLFMLWNFIGIMFALLCVAILCTLYVVMTNYGIHSGLALTMVLFLSGLIIFIAYFVANRIGGRVGSSKTISVVQEFVQGFMQK